MGTFNSVMSVAGSVILAILILLVMVTVHEFGHYIAGKTLKFKINEFAIGFGPKLFKHKSKKSGEVFSVRLLPLGGFCAFEGEDGDGAAANPEAFTNKAPWKRIIVLIAGPLMNYLLALLLITIAMFSFGQMTYKIGSVARPSEDGADAEQFIEYSFEENDVILKIDGRNIYLSTDFVAALGGKKQGETVTVTVDRQNEIKDVEIMLREDCDFENMSDMATACRALGVGTYAVAPEGEGEVKLYYDISPQSYRFGFFTTLGHSFQYSWRIAGSIFRILGELLTGRLGLRAMGGPVTTIKLTSSIATRSLQSFFEIAAYIGVNLAVFNLLPIPALDGSKVIFCLIEWIFRKPVPRKIEAVIHTVGFFAILGFAVLVDILQFV